MQKNNSSFSLAAALIASWLFAGCSLTYTMDKPTLSHINYTEHATDPVVIMIVDKRMGDDMHYVVGKLGVGATMGDISGMLKFTNIDDPMAFFASNLEMELRERDLNVSCQLEAVENPDAVLEVQRYQIVNYRATGFSPWEAGHVFSGTLNHDGHLQIIKSYIYNGKTPVWSMNEIQTPCFNIPASILIQDVASKINACLFKLQAPGTEIDRLTVEIDTELNKNPEIGPFWQVLELGYTNNPSAVESLKKYARQGDAFFKSCAISALGLISTGDELAFLKQLHDDTIYNEKYMTVKAIGDIGGDAAMDLIKKMKEEPIYESEGGLKTAVDLYLQ